MPQLSGAYKQVTYMITIKDAQNNITNRWLDNHTTALSTECLNKLVNKFATILDFATLEPEHYANFFKKSCILYTLDGEFDATIKPVDNRVSNIESNNGKYSIRVLNTLIRHKFEGDTKPVFYSC